MSDDQQIDVIRDDIEQTRADMGQTIDQIQERLDPDVLRDQAQTKIQEIADQILDEVRTKTDALTEQITEQINAAVQGVATTKVDEALTKASDTARQVGTSLWERMSQNPAPIALAALGIGLVATQAARDGNSKSSTQGTSGQSGQSGLSGQGTQGMQGQAQGAKDKAAGMASQAQDKAGEAMDQAKQGASQLADQAQQGLEQVKQAMPSSPQDFLQQQPLVAGALALGLGFVAGLSLPETQREQQAIAPIREQVKDQVDQLTGAGQGLVDQAKQAATEVAGQAKDAAKESAQEVKGAAKDLGQTAKQSGKQAAKDRGLAG